MQHLIGINVRYIGPTNNRGSRIKLELPRFEASKTISYRYDKRDAEEGALEWLKENSVEPIARACGSDHSAILLVSWDNVKKLETLFGF